MNSKVLKRLLSYFGKYKGKLTTALVTCLIGTLFTIIAPKIIGQITTILYAGVEDGLWTVQELADGTGELRDKYKEFSSGNGSPGFRSGRSRRSSLSRSSWLSCTFCRFCSAA